MNEKMSEAQVAECRREFHEFAAGFGLPTRRMYIGDSDALVYPTLDTQTAWAAFQAAWNRRPERGEVVTREISLLTTRGMANVKMAIRESISRRFGVVSGQNVEDTFSVLMDTVDALKLLAPMVAVPSMDTLTEIVSEVNRGRQAVSWAVDQIRAHLLATTKQAPDVGAVREALEALAVASNGVTVYWRHQHRVNAIPGRKLDRLYDAQLAAEDALVALESTPTANPQQNDAQTGMEEKR